ncbi:MAG: HAMP domain-containing sensor histidine kinase [Clostridiales bacterium]|nr:HAMP domain-containing sensor histidine kinase [Clostridiales bacterium]
MKGPDEKKKHRFGIRWKMTMGLMLIFLVSGLVMYGLMMRDLHLRMETQIGTDIQSIWQNSNIYTRQLLVTYGYNNDEEGFRQIWEFLREELNDGRADKVAAYDQDGSPLAGGKGNMSLKGKNLFERAAEGKPVFQMDYNYEDYCLVSFVLPVEVEEKVVGYLYYQMDYSDTQKENIQFVRRMIQIIILIFCLSFLLCWGLLSQILAPILRLSRLSQRVSHVSGEENLSDLPEVRMSMRSRRDEIGELSENMNRMFRTMENQFRKIERDKTKMEELLESKQNFFDNATHELKTPLTTIQGYAQLIQQDDGRDKELFDKGMNHILKESQRLYQMVIQLLDMSDNRHHQEFKPMNLADLAERVAASMELRASRYGNTICFVRKEPCWILGQENRMRQLLINLLDNAVKYGKENKPIDLKVEGRDGQVIVTVINRGEGVHSQELEKIFEPFYRVNKAWSREQGSAGLGLAICQKIVMEHGGSIQAESEPGAETIFRVILSSWNAGDRGNHEKKKNG